MEQSLEKVLERVRSLPEERQRYIARLLEDALGGDGDVVVLSDEERRLVREGLDDLDAGRTVGEAEMEAFWNRNRR